MRYGILADIHSNLEALETVLGALERERPDRILCAGDLVGYGPDPAACLALIRQRRIPAVGGNHDWAVAGKLELAWFNETSGRAVEWTMQQLGEADRRWLGELPLLLRDAEITLVHASCHEPAQFPYLFDLVEVERSFTAQETPIAFIGHTHRPAVYTMEAGRVRGGALSEGKVPVGEKVLVNVGSVGQPRDGDCRASYCLYDSKQNRLEIRRLPYHLERTQAKIRKAGLPEFLAQRLAVGY